LSLWEPITRLFWQIFSWFFWKIVGQSFLYKLSNATFVRKISTIRVIGRKYPSCIGRLRFLLLSLWQSITRLFWQIVAQIIIYKLSNVMFVRKMSTIRVIGRKYPTGTSRLRFRLLSVWQPVTRSFWQVSSLFLWQIVAQSFFYKLLNDMFERQMSTNWVIALNLPRCTGTSQFVLLSLWQPITRLFWQISRWYFWQIVRKMSTIRVIGRQYPSCIGRLRFLLLSLWHSITRLFWQIFSWFFWQIVGQSVLYKLSNDMFERRKFTIVFDILAKPIGVVQFFSI